MPFMVLRKQQQNDEQQNDEQKSRYTGLDKKRHFLTYCRGRQNPPDIYKSPRIIIMKRNSALMFAHRTPSSTGLIGIMSR